MGVEHASPVMLLIIVAILAPVLVFIRKARLGKEFYVRRIAGISAIDEAIGRSAELGRPISFSTGLTDVSPTLYAILGVLFHVAKKAATYKSKLLIPQRSAEVMAIVEDVAKDAYREQGKLSLFDPKNILFLSEEQFAFAAGYMGTIQRENVASAFLFGSFAAESLLLAEAGQQVGAMQVAASVSPEQVPFFITACDHTLIGEELYAASAYLTREPVQVGSLIAQDRAKIFVFLLILVGVVLATFHAVYPDDCTPNIEAILRASWDSYSGGFSDVKSSFCRWQ